MMSYWEIRSNLETGFPTNSLQKITFSLIVIFYFTKTANRTKNDDIDNTDTLQMVLNLMEK